MSHIFGAIETSGQRTKRVTRCANKSEGLFATLATRRGALVLHVWHDAETGEDLYTVEQDTHKMPGKVQKAGIYKQVAAGCVGVAEDAAG